MSTVPKGKAVAAAPKDRLQAAQCRGGKAKKQGSRGVNKGGRPPHSPDEKAAAYELKKQRQRDKRTTASEQRIAAAVDAATTAERANQTSLWGSPALPWWAVPAATRTLLQQLNSPSTAPGLTAFVTGQQQPASQAASIRLQVSTAQVERADGRHSSMAGSLEVLQRATLAYSSRPTRRY